MVVCTNLCRKDPLGRLVLQKLRIAPSKLALITLVYYLLFLPLGGMYAQYTYPGPFVGVLEQEELVNTVASFLMFAPLISWFYTWQLTYVPTLYSRLLSNRVIGPPLDEKRWKSLEEYLEAKLIKPLNSGWLCGFALILALAGSVYFTILAYSDKSAGMPRWYIVYNWMFFLLYLPPITLFSYAMSVATVRHIIIVKALNATLRDFQLTVHPLHPDRVGGLGPLGRFSISSGLLAFAVGVWVNAVVFSPVLYGQIPDLNLYTIGSYAAYVALAPLLVIAPVIGARRSMVAAKQQELRRVADAFDRALKQSQRELSDIRHLGSLLTNVKNVASLKARNEILDELKRRYTLVEKSFPTLPFSLPQIRGLAISGLTPLLPGVILSAVELYLKYF